MQNRMKKTANCRKERKCHSEVSLTLKLVKNSNHQKCSAKEWGQTGQSNQAPFSADDIRNEFELAASDCQRYFERMYKIIDFSAVAIIALLGIGCNIFAEDIVAACLVFGYFLPGCVGVFGMLYAYNAYALAACGKKAELLHGLLYEGETGKTEKINAAMNRYIVTDDVAKIIAYGVVLAFYMLIPAVSVAFTLWHLDHFVHWGWYGVLPGLCVLVYWMFVIIIVKEIIHML